MIDGYPLNMRAFNDVSDGKGQAPKPPEEADEVSGARQECEDIHDLIDECVDTVQAIADLLAAVGATQGDVDAAIKRMDERNGNRGRFGNGG